MYGIYRSPTKNVVPFINDLKNELESIDPNGLYYILGDMNIDLLNQDDRNVIEYCNILSSLGFDNMVTDVTRAHDTSMSCIDHIITRSSDILLYPGVIKTSITDHYSTTLAIVDPQARKVRDESEEITVKKIDYSALGKMIECTNWSLVFVDGLNDSVNAFISMLKMCIEKCTVIKKYKRNYNKLTPWISLGMIVSIKNRDKIAAKVKKQPYNTSLKIYYRRYRNMLRNLVRKARESYYSNKLELAEGDSRKTWEVIKEVLNRKNISGKSNEFIAAVAEQEGLTKDEVGNLACDKLNDYFVNIGKNLANQCTINPSFICNDQPLVENIEFNIPEIDENGLKRVMNQMKGRSAPGVDGIHLHIIKKFFDSLKGPLVYIFNLSIRSCVFPDSFKLAKVCPIYKDGDKSDPGNFRPISMLSCVGKILEKWIKIHLTIYLETNKLICNEQYGFRSSRGVDQAMFELTGDLFQLRDNRKKGILLFCDLSKCFDTIDRKILLRRMEKIGVRNGALKWFTSYLTNRKQIVSVGEFSSQAKEVEYGVIQGGTLSATLFLIYINALPLNIPHHKVYLFADDTSVLITGDVWESVFSDAQRALDVLRNWFSCSGLTLNSKKTKYMLMGSGKGSRDIGNHCLMCHGCGGLPDCQCLPLQRVDSYRYLGVIIDEELKWKKHIDSVYSKLRKLLYIFFHVRKVFRLNKLRLIYMGLVQSIIQYGIVVWGGTYATHLDKVNVVQKDIIKIIMRKPRIYPSVKLFQEFKVFAPRQLFLKALLLMFHKNPNIIYVNHQHERSTRYRLVGNVIPPRPTLALTTKSPHYIIFIVHRMIDPQLKCPLVCSRNVYKRKIFEWILKIGYLEAENIINSIYA